MKLKSLIQDAYKNRFAIGAFNVYNLETVQAVIEAGRRAKQPIILQLSEKALEYAGFDQITAIIKRAQLDNDDPIFLHLDHGRDISLVKKCIADRFDSVMYDGSHLPVEENIEISASLRKIAQQRDVVFEAEIGKVGGQEDKISACEFKTSPDQALDYYNAVKPDMLAVAIGNIHGELTAQEQLDFTLLAKISEMVKCPLVLHGCSNREDKEYKVAIAEGVVKINIDTELRQAFVRGLQDALKKKEKDPRKILSIAKIEVTKQTEDRIAIFSAAC
jgi:fructose-bisphosphate aldolase class II